MACSNFRQMYQPCWYKPPACCRAVAASLIYSYTRRSAQWHGPMGTKLSLHPSYCLAQVLYALLTLLVAFSVASSTAASQVPTYEAQKWNQAWKLSVTNITAAQQVQLDIVLSSGWGVACQDVGYDTPPLTAPLNACYRRRNAANGTWSYWVKRAGEH